MVPVHGATLLEIVKLILCFAGHCTGKGWRGWKTDSDISDRLDKSKEDLDTDKLF